MALNSKIELKKKYLVLNIIGFLQDELIHTGMSEDKKESVEVAIQCLESAFDLENDLGVRISRERVNLLALIPMRVFKTIDYYLESVTLNHSKIFYV